MDSKPIKWRIYYDDDTTFDNTQGEPWEAPGRGVVCIVQIDPSPRMYNVNTQVLMESPFFWYHREFGYWFRSEQNGLIDQLTNDRKNIVCAVKLGRWTDFTHYREILYRANNDKDFVKKSGIGSGEKDL